MALSARNGVLIFAAAGLLAAAVLWLLSAPQRLPAGALDGLAGDAARGETVFLIAGCASCHSAPKAEGEARLTLSGGKRFVTEFGTFVAPNISTDMAQGLGGWSLNDFANAVLRGVAPDGRHYYPAFPYVSYAGMTEADVADLWAYWATLPASDAESPPHEIGFPFNIRRALGLWKQLNFNAAPAPVVATPANDPVAARGRYLVEGPGHCAECHTPRGPLGGLDRSDWLAGAPNPDGKGRIPDIRNVEGAAGAWGAIDLVAYFSTGFTPDYDSAGGAMAEVIENTSQLPASDLEAIAAYLAIVKP